MKKHLLKMKVGVCFSLLGMSLFMTACQCPSSESTGSQSEKLISLSEETKTNEPVYTEPPVMTINYGNQTLSIPAFGYEWNYQVSEKEDTWSGAVADAAHPLDQNYTDRIFYLDPANSVHEVSMNFEITPKSIEVLTYWPAPVGADALPHQSMPAPDEEIDYDSGIPYENTADITDPNIFLAFEGRYIYEIYATFEADKYHGGAYYTVLIKDDSDSVTETE